MNETIATDAPLAEPAARLLKAIAAAMIPADAACGVPGADDPQIFADILASCASSHKFINAELSSFDRQIDLDTGSSFHALNEQDQAAAIARLRAQAPDLIGLLLAVVVMCYYRNDRVMTSLDMAPRAPFPEGFEVAGGDWSLLDPVRARGRLWRDA